MSGFADGNSQSARFNRPTALAWQDAACTRLLIVDSGNARIRLLDCSSDHTAVRTVANTNSTPTGIGVNGADIGIAMPDAGIVRLGSRALKSLPIQLKDNPASNTGSLKMMNPCALLGSASEWYVVDSKHGALMRLAGDSLEVLVGICMTNNSIYGNRDGTGDRAQLGIISSIASDGKGHLILADSTNNAIRRVTLPTGSAPADTSSRVGDGN